MNMYVSIYNIDIYMYITYVHIYISIQICVYIYIHMFPLQMMPHVTASTTPPELCQYAHEIRECTSQTRPEILRKKRVEEEKLLEGTLKPTSFNCTTVVVS